MTPIYPTCVDVSENQPEEGNLWDKDIWESVLDVETGELLEVSGLNATASSSRGIHAAIETSEIRTASSQSNPSGAEFRARVSGQQKVCGSRKALAKLRAAPRERPLLPKFLTKIDGKVPLVSKDHILTFMPPAARPQPSAVASSHRSASREPNKKRMRWTRQLRLSFRRAVEELGGPENATPKKVLRAMDISGLSLWQVKSFLQKYRLTQHRGLDNALSDNSMTDEEGSSHSGGGGPAGSLNRSRSRGDEAAQPRVTKQKSGSGEVVEDMLTDSLVVHLEMMKEVQDLLEEQYEMQAMIEEQQSNMVRILMQQSKGPGACNLANSAASEAFSLKAAIPTSASCSRSWAECSRSLEVEAPVAMELVPPSAGASHFGHITSQCLEPPCSDGNSPRGAADAEVLDSEPGRALPHMGEAGRKHWWNKNDELKREEQVLQQHIRQRQLQHYVCSHVGMGASPPLPMTPCPTRWQELQAGSHSSVIGADNSDGRPAFQEVVTCPSNLEGGCTPGGSAVIAGCSPSVRDGAPYDEQMALREEPAFHVNSSAVATSYGQLRTIGDSRGQVAEGMGSSIAESGSNGILSMLDLQEQLMSPQCDLGAEGSHKHSRHGPVVRAEPDEFQPRCFEELVQERAWELQQVLSVETLPRDVPQHSLPDSQSQLTGQLHNLYNHEYPIAVAHLAESAVHRPPTEDIQMALESKANQMPEPRAVCSPKQPQAPFPFPQRSQACNWANEGQRSAPSGVEGSWALPVVNDNCFQTPSSLRSACQETVVKRQCSAHEAEQNTSEIRNESLEGSLDVLTFFSHVPAGASSSGSAENVCELQEADSLAMPSLATSVSRKAHCESPLFGPSQAAANSPLFPHQLPPAVRDMDAIACALQTLTQQCQELLLPHCSPIWNQ